MGQCAGSELQTLDPSCPALKKKGGVKKKVWAILFELVTFEFDGDGNVTGFTIESTSPATKLVTYTSRKLKNNGTFAGEFGENSNTLQQSLNLKLYYKLQTERNAIDLLFNSEEVVVFIETNAGQIEVWGLETGLLPSAFTGGTGTLLNDDTGALMTLSGAQDTLPKVCKFGATLVDDIAYLDALT